MAEYWFSQNGPNDIETATIHNPNIYANASLYNPYVNNSPPPGNVAKAQLWIDANQFTGAYCYNGWPQPCDDFRQDVQIWAVCRNRLAKCGSLCQCLSQLIPAWRSIQQLRPGKNQGSAGLGASACYGGTLLTFDPPLEIDRLRLTVDAVTGRWYWSEVAALNEIEVIGQVTEPWPELEISYTLLPFIQR